MIFGAHMDIFIEQIEDFLVSIKLSFSPPPLPIMLIIEPRMVIIF